MILRAPNEGLPQPFEHLRVESDGGMNGLSRLVLGKVK
jgi:hypothetical protein